MNNDSRLTSDSSAEISPFWWVRWVPTVVVSALVLYFIYVIGNAVIVPVLASFALAYLLNPIVYAGEKRGLSRMAASIAAIFLVGFVIATFLAYVVPDLWAETSKAGKKIAENFTPENAARQRDFLRRYSPALESVAGEKIEEFLSKPMTFYSKNVATTTTVDANGNTTVSGGGGLALLTVVGSSLDLLLVPFFVFYLLIDFQKWRESLEDLIPPRFRDPFSRLFDESGRILESYVRGQLLIGLIMAVLYALGFYFLGVPAWAGIALIAGLLNSIPYIGTISGIILACGFTFADGGGWGQMAAVVGVFAAVQTLEGYILTPKILGERLNLHPMAVFLGLLVGGKLFGLLGVILAIPSIAIAKVFFKFLRELYQVSHFYHAGDIHASQAPSENLEERIADAAETVLAEQVQKGIDEEIEKEEEPEKVPVIVEETI